MLARPFANRVRKFANPGSLFGLGISATHGCDRGSSHLRLARGSGVSLYLAEAEMAGDRCNLMSGAAGLSEAPTCRFSETMSAAPLGQPSLFAPFPEKVAEPSR